MGNEKGFDRWLAGYAAYLKTTFAENGKALRLVIGLFCAGAVLGALQTDSIANLVNSLTSNLIARFQDVQGFSLFLKLFLHNTLAAVTSAASGILFGIFPAISALVNGLMVGSVLVYTHTHTDWNLLTGILSLLPHGVFELPAFFLSLAVGLRIGTWPLKKEKRAFLVDTFNSSSAIFFKIIIPLLLLAAAIETIGIERLRIP